MITLFNLICLHLIEFPAYNSIGEVEIKLLFLPHFSATNPDPSFSWSQSFYRKISHPPFFFLWKKYKSGFSSNLGSERNRIGKGIYMRIQ